MTYTPPVIVPAPPPRPPQLSLLASALRMPTGSDPSSAFPEIGIKADISPEVWAELETRRGEMWVRGITYAPENRGQAEARAGDDYTTVDFSALPTPSGLALAGAVGGGTLVAGTYRYEVAAIDANGHTAASAPVDVTLGATGSVVVTWNKVAQNCTYAIFGRVAGSLGLLATVGPFDNDQAATWTDTGAATPGVAPYATNTTAGPGVYTNPGIVSMIPWLAVVMDTCSSWGWSERDFIGRASRWLENAKYAAIEREFQTGALATAKGWPNNFLTNATSLTDLTPGTVPSVARGQAILQDALASCGFGGQGMIHVQPQTAPSLLNARRVGGLMLDEFDNLVVPGAGYQNLGPGNVAPSAGQAWLYATDLVTCWEEEEPTITPDTLSEALDRGQNGAPNTITFRAQKFVGASMDASCHFACKVALPS